MEFMDLEHDPGISNGANRPTENSTASTQCAVVFLVEATGKLHRHIDALKSAYITPLLSYFRSTFSSSEQPDRKWMKNVLYGFVFFYSADAPRGQEVYSGVEPNDNEEAVLYWFDNVPVERAPFIHSHQCCLLEAITAGVDYLDRMIANFFQPDHSVEKHMVIVAQSAPYSERLVASKVRPQTLPDAAQLIAENAVHLSVINTRKSKPLRVLFNDSRDLSAFTETTSNTTDQHMVLLNNISIRSTQELTFSAQNSVAITPSASTFSPLTTVHTAPVNVGSDTPPATVKPEIRTTPQPSLPPVSEEKPAPKTLHELLTKSPLQQLLGNEGPLSVGAPEMTSSTSSTSNVEPRFSPAPHLSTVSGRSDSPTPKPVTSGVTAPTPSRSSPQIVFTPSSISHIPNTNTVAPSSQSSKAQIVNVATLAQEANNSSNGQFPPRVGTAMAPQLTGMMGQLPAPGAFPAPPNMSQTPASNTAHGQPRIDGNRCICWEGILEWVVQAQSSKIVHQMPADIWVPAGDFMVFERWPGKVNIQMLPANLTEVAKPFLDNAIKVNFNMKLMNESVGLLQDKLASRLPNTPSLAGAIFFSSTGPTPVPCVIIGAGRGDAMRMELRVVIFLCHPNAPPFQGFYGLIPRDQVGFMESLRQFTRNKLQHDQQRQQMAARHAATFQNQQQQQGMMNQQRSVVAGGMNQFGQYGNDANLMPQQNNPMMQPNMPMGYSQGPGVHSPMITEQAARLQQQQQQQHQQQQNIRMMYQQQQQQQPQSGGPQMMPNNQDPQLRALLQNSSPNLHVGHFDG